MLERFSVNAFVEREKNGSEIEIETRARFRARTLTHLACACGLMSLRLLLSLIDSLLLAGEKGQHSVDEPG